MAKASEELADTDENKRFRWPPRWRAYDDNMLTDGTIFASFCPLMMKTRHVKLTAETSKHTSGNESICRCGFAE